MRAAVAVLSALSSATAHSSLIIPMSRNAVDRALPQFANGSMNKIGVSGRCRCPFRCRRCC